MLYSSSLSVAAASSTLFLHPLRLRQLAYSTLRVATPPSVKLSHPVLRPEQGDSERDRTCWETLSLVPFIILTALFLDVSKGVRKSDE